MYLNHKQTKYNILKSEKNIIVWGLSLTTKEILNIDKSIKNKIKYIVDKNEKLQNTTYKNIQIIDPKKLKSLNNYLIILWGGHTLSISKYLIKNSIKNFIIDYTKSTNYIPHNLTIQVDKIDKNQNNHDKNFIFSKQISDYIYQQPFNLLVKPFKSQIYPALSPKKIDKNLLLISYHTKGKSNKQILRWKEGYLQEMVTFDKKGYSGWSSLCTKNIDKLLKNIPSKKANQTFEFLSNKYISTNLSKYIQPKNSKFTFPKKFIFFPLQTIHDSVMYHSYFNPTILIKKIVTILNEKNIPLVIKQHPLCNDEKVSKLLKKYENEKKIILYAGSIHDAILKATTIYTINSGVGFEALLHLKPVVTFGKSDYMSMTKNVNDLDIIKKEPFYSIDEKQKDIIKKFLHYYIDKKSIFINDDNEKKLKKLINSFIINYLNQRENISDAS